MNEEQRQAIIERLNGVVRDLNHWAFVAEARERSAVEHMREDVLEGITLIYEQETIIKALMGDYGDACDIEGSGEDEPDV